MPIPTRAQSVRSQRPEKKKVETEGMGKSRVPVVTNATSHLPQLTSSSQSTSRVVSTNIGQPRTTLVTAAGGGTTRPQAITYQQQINQRKPSSTQALTTAHRQVSPNVTADVKASKADSHHLRDELLQTTLLYSISLNTSRQYEDDAESKLRQRFNSLSIEHRELNALENERQHVQHSLAVQAWLKEPATSSLSVSKVQTLAGCIQDLTDLTSGGGLLTRVMQQFESWCIHASVIREKRSEPADMTQEDLPFIEPIGAEWLEKLVYLQEQLADSERVLESLGTSEGGLGAVLDNHLLLTRAFLHELQTCLDIENRLLDSDRAWMQESISNLLSAPPDQAEQPPVGGARRGSWHITTARGYRSS